MMKDLLEKSVDGGGVSPPFRYEVKVSSVLNRQVKEYGKEFMFDGREDTCWNSDQGSPQWVRINFLDGVGKVQFEEIRLMFQGGFCGRTCFLETSDDGKEFTRVLDIFPEDVNKLQRFKLGTSGPMSCRSLRLVFEDSTDFFGRITLYQFKLMTSD